MPRLPLLFLLSGLLLTFAACDDTSNVGLGLVGEEGQPEIRTLDISRFEQASYGDITGAVQRVLTGSVADPLAGQITAEGFVDFTGSFGTPDDSTVVGVTLQLATDYVYGDTTAMITLQLRDVLEEWEDTALRADTSLATDQTIITEVSFLPTDTLVNIQLPPNWVARNDTSFVSSDFAESFHGFSLRASAGNAVVGFDVLGSGLQVFVPGDTVNFAPTETFSRIERTGTPALPDDRFLLQDGSSPTVRVDFDLSGNTLTPINGARLTVFADTLLNTDAPPGFVRPLPRRLNLARIDADGDAFLLDEGVMLDEDGAFRFDNSVFRSVLQRTVLGESLADHYELRFPIANNTINSLFLYGPNSAEDVAPDAFLTVSPSN